MLIFNKNKTITAIIGLIISCSIIALCFYFDPGGPITGLPFTYIMLRIASLTASAFALAFVVLIFFNKSIFWYTFTSIAGIYVLRTIAEAVMGNNFNTTTFFLSVIIFGFLSIYFIKQYKTNKKSINSEMPDEDEELNILYSYSRLIQDEDFKRAISYLDKSIILGSTITGTLYQVIKTNRFYYFHHIGSLIKGMDHTKLFGDFENLEVNLEFTKKDFIIEISDIKSIEATIKNKPSMLDYGNININLSNKTKSFGFINLFEENELKKFFGLDIFIKTKYQKQQEEPQEIETNKDVKKLNAINRFLLIFCLLGCACFTLYLFFNYSQLDNILSIICLLFTITPFFIYLLLQKYLTLKESNKTKALINNKIQFMYPLFIFPTLLALKCAFELNVLFSLDYTKLITTSLIAFVVLLVIFLLFSKEYKKNKAVLFSVILVLLFIAPTCVTKINSTFDYSAPETIICEIIDTPTHTSNSGDITYYVTFNYDNEEIKYEVPEEIYSTTVINESTITLLKYKGALGIERVVYDSIQNELLS